MGNKNNIVMAIDSSATATLWGAVAYRLAVKLIPSASFVNATQLITCSIFVLALKFGGFADVDNLVWVKVKPYLYYTVAFAAGCWSNMRALQASNVETLIVFRSAMPLAVCLIDYEFLGREFPSGRSLASLACVALGATGYVLTDKAFSMAGIEAYYWVTVYFFLIVFQMTYGKYIIDAPEYKKSSTWGPVLYNNLLGIAPAIVLGVMLGEFSIFTDKDSGFSFTLHSLNVLFVTWVIGIGIGGATFYKQAPLRKITSDLRMTADEADSFVD